MGQSMKGWGLLASMFAGVLAINPSGAAALEQYLCIGEKANGFRWNGTEWIHSTFKTDADKFLVYEVKPYELLDKIFTFEVKRFGSDKVVQSCERYKTETYVGTRIICGGLGHGMLIDTKSLRYQEVYGLGYIEGKDTDGNTPSLTIGTCTRLN